MVEDPYPHNLDYQQVIDLNNNIWQCLTDVQNTNLLPNAVVVQLRENLALLRRSQEETVAVYRDIQQTFETRLAEHCRIAQEFKRQSGSLRESAIKCQLVCLGWNIETVLSRFVMSFSDLCFPKVPSTFRDILNFTEIHHGHQNSSIPESDDEDSDDYFDDWENVEDPTAISSDECESENYL